MKLSLLLLFVIATVHASLWSMLKIQLRLVLLGKNAIRHQFPYIVSIQQQHHICGGAIISPTYVISAAHCFVKKQLHLFVIAGLLVQGEDHPDNQIVVVEEIVKHPQYQNYNDVALLKLKTRLSFTPAVQPIALPGMQQEFHGRAVIAGWNSVMGFLSIMPNGLQYLEMSLISVKECNRRLYETAVYPIEVMETQMCAMGDNQGESACRGDSGGPLVQNGKLIGIIKGGDKYCGSLLDEPSPNVFTKVSSYLSFIKEHVRDLEEL